MCVCQCVRVCLSLCSLPFKQNVSWIKAKCRGDKVEFDYTFICSGFTDIHVWPCVPFVVTQCTGCVSSHIFAHLLSPEHLCCRSSFCRALVSPRKGHPKGNLFKSTHHRALGGSSFLEDTWYWPHHDRFKVSLMFYSFSPQNLCLQSFKGIVHQKIQILIENFIHLIFFSFNYSLNKN